MKVVFDSNVFVSALAIPGGQAERAFELVVDGHVDLYLSRAIIHQVLGVLARKFSRDAEALSRTALLLSELGTLVTPRRRLAVLQDEPDNRVLECARTAEADLIVTGDKAMLALERYERIRIVTLREFLAEADPSAGREA